MQHLMSQMETHPTAECKPPSALVRLWDWVDYCRRDPPRFRGVRVATLLGLLWLLNMIDLLLTLRAMRAGGFFEANPLARLMIHDPGSLVLFKIVLVTIGTTTLYLSRHRREAELASVAASAVYLALMGMWGVYYYLLP